MTGLEFKTKSGSVENRSRHVASAPLGLYRTLLLVCFAFSAPSVFVRRMEVNYTMIAILVGGLAVGWIVLSLIRRNGNSHFL